MAVELELASCPVPATATIAFAYESVDVGSARLDLVVGGKLLVELKAVDQLLPIDMSQVISFGVFGAFGGSTPPARPPHR